MTPPITSDLKRAAMALRSQLEEHGQFSFGECRILVRAVLTALREPSEGMKAAGEAYDDPPAHCCTYWRAMIDHIIAQQEPG